MSGEEAGEKVSCSGSGRVTRRSWCGIGVHMVDCPGCDECPCPDCGGSGIKYACGPYTCQTCNGTGRKEEDGE